MPTPKILYAGDSAVGGPANYLLAILKHLGIRFVHVPPSRKLVLKERFDAFILSDFPRKNLSRDSEKRLCGQVSGGSGLLMIGGWASYSGPFGGWQGSQVEKLLPVQCASGDDRLNFPGGALLNLKSRDSMFGRFSFSNSPVICGMNQVRVKKSGRVLLTARRLTDQRHFPLLVVDEERPIAALTTDLAPHWCGGMVDWGRKSRKLPVTLKIEVEVGETYVRFVEAIISWLLRR